MNFLEKIQNLPEETKKIILWTVIVIIGLALFTLFIKNFQQQLKSFEAEKFKEGLKLPDLGEELKWLPEIEAPNIEMLGISEEELKELEKIFGELPTSSEQTP